MTLGPKFFFCNKMITARRRKHLNPWFLAESAAFYLYFLILVSDHDLNPSGTFFENLHATLDSQLTNNQQPTTSNQQPTTNNQQPTTTFLDLNRPADRADQVGYGSDTPSLSNLSKVWVFSKILLRPWICRFNISYIGTRILVNVKNSTFSRFDPTKR